MDFTKFTPEELNKMDKQVLITIIGSLQGQLNFLTRQITLMSQRFFGRRTESIDGMHQMTLFEVFNKPELLCDDSREPEVSEITVSSHTRQAKSKCGDSLEGLPVEVYKRLSVSPQTFLGDVHHVHVYTAKNYDGTIVRVDRPADVFCNSIANLF